MTLPRALVFTPRGPQEWVSTVVPRYQRRLREVNTAVAMTYLAGATTRRLKGALRPLLKAAPLSRSAVSRIVGTLKSALDTWAARSLAELDVVYVYLDAIALRIRGAGRVGSTPALAAVGVLALELCGGESAADLAGLRRWARGPGAAGAAAVHHRRQLRLASCRDPRLAAGGGATLLHKFHNLQAKAPAHARVEVTADFHRIV